MNDWDAYLGIPSDVEIARNATAMSNFYIYKNNIYIGSKYVYKYTQKTYDNGTIVISLGDKYGTRLFDNSENTNNNTRFICHFSDADYYENGILSLPMYYGNGSQWIKFKN